MLSTCANGQKTAAISPFVHTGLPQTLSQSQSALAHETKNHWQASVCGSVLRANLQFEANEDLAKHIARKGANLIHFGWDTHFVYIYAHSSNLAHFIDQSARSMYQMNSGLDMYSNSCKVCRACTRHAHWGEVHLPASKVGIYVSQRFSLFPQKAHFYQTPFLFPTWFFKVYGMS